MRPPVARLVTARRGFSTSRSLQQVRIYTPVRNTGDFHTALRTSTTANTPLITLFTASYCPSCRVVKAALEKHFKERGDAAPDLQYAEVELDAQGGGVEELGSRYMIRSLPTLLPFRRGEAVNEKRMTDVREMSDRSRLGEWVEDIARDGAQDRSAGGGGGLFGRMFGG